MNPPSLPDFVTATFLERMMNAFDPTRAIRIRAVVPRGVDNSASILVTLTTGRSAQPIGHFGLVVDLEVDGRTEKRNLVLKLKPHGREISAMLESLAQACGGRLAEVYPTFAAHTGFGQTHRRELDVYRSHADPILPQIWGVWADEAAERYAVLMEYLDDVTLLNSVQTPAAWTDRYLRAALEQLAAWHARHLTDAPPAWPDAPSRAYQTQLIPLWEALLDNARTRFPAWYTPDRAARLQAAIARIPEYWTELESRPRTLIHNDFNPRNTCFRTGPGTPQLVAYDWELATYHVPVYDVIELLNFVLTPDRYAERLGYLEHYRQALHARTGRYPDAADFRREAGYAALDFGLHRLGMYLMAHSVSPYLFLPRVVDSYFDTLEQLGEV